MKICDLTQFYSPVSGGVKRYLAEKVRYLQTCAPEDEHILVVPGERDHCEEGLRSRVYTIRSPLISRTSRYRILLRLEAVERILERERPHLIESGDPYQLAWKAVYSGRALHIPVISFYHSHFPEAYLRSSAKFLGATATEFVLDFSKRYIRRLYNHFERTLVPSPALGDLLGTWGVDNVFHTELGVDVSVFHPTPTAEENVRAEFGIPANRPILLYIGRLAQEKNTQTLFRAFRRLEEAGANCHLIVIGDGLQRRELEQLKTDLASRSGRPPITWLPYCAEASRLAELYRAADLFVHPGVQETFGLVTLESQACGTPVIGIHGSYMDRIIHGSQASWARENSPEALAGAVTSALASHLKVHSQGLAARIAARYSWTGVFDRLFDLYRQVVREYRQI